MHRGAFCVAQTDVQKKTKSLKQLHKCLVNISTENVRDKKAISDITNLQQATLRPVFITL